MISNSSTHADPQDKLPSPELLCVCVHDTCPVGSQLQQMVTTIQDDIGGYGFVQFSIIRCGYLWDSRELVSLCTFCKMFYLCYNLITLFLYCCSL